MQLDIYRRPETDGRASYLAVPAGCPIPPEADNTDWQREASALELDEAAPELPMLGIQRPAEQLREKGYAITSLHRQPDEAPPASELGRQPQSLC